ncbi:MAG TPA: hypothetical protein VMU29_11925 [Smithella sp.]|nr:hypothetical protein [Smithella sp.]
MRKTIALFTFVCTLWGAFYALAKDQDVARPYDKSISAAQALDIAETTFRYQFDHAPYKGNVPFFFLELFGKDPNSNFLSRFKDHIPPIRRGSEFKDDSLKINKSVSSEPTIRVRGVKFYVKNIKRLSDTTVEVFGCYYVGPLAAAGYTYTVEFKNGKWAVTAVKMDWIS